MAVKIRLKRMGKIRAPFYRVVVMDSRTKRDGRAIEEIGKYHPTEEPSVIDIDMERADYWLSQGAQPTEAVAALLKLTKEGNVRTKPAKPSKKELYEAAIAAAGKSSDDASGATTPKKRAAAKKTEEPKTEEPKTEEPKAEEPKAEEVAPAADTDSGAAAAESTDADADKA
ncbi:30S ribosomal protein S16 [Phycicoccus ginsengisoli]